MLYQGCPISSKGKILLEIIYCGGATFWDQASGFIYVQPQATFSLVETLQAKLTFERMCLTNGKGVVSYMSDNSTAFSFKEFVSKIINSGQDSCHSAVGAQHHNRVAK